MSCPCDKEECVKEWQSYVEYDSDGNVIKSSIDDYEEGGYQLTHCEIEKCHVIYWKGKNGGTCEKCFIEVCEGCQCDTGEQDDDDWLCDECK